MNPNLVTPQVAQSPKKTGMTIFAVSTIIIGGGLLVKYLVDKSREEAGYPPSKEAGFMSRLFPKRTPQTTQTQQGLTEEQKYSMLLDRATAFWNQPSGTTYTPSATSGSTAGAGASTTSTSSSASSAPAAQDFSKIGCNSTFSRNKPVEMVTGDNVFNINFYVRNVNKCGPAVYAFQQELQKAGCAVTPDGRYGENTKLAHKKYDTIKNLENELVESERSMIKREPYCYKMRDSNTPFGRYKSNVTFTAGVLDCNSTDQQIRAWKEVEASLWKKAKNECNQEIVKAYERGQINLSKLSALKYS